MGQVDLIVTVFVAILGIGLGVAGGILFGVGQGRPRLLAGKGGRGLHRPKEAERLDRRREDLDKRYERMDQRERDLNKRQSVLDKQKQQLDKMTEERTAALERIAQMTKDEARGELIAAVEKESRADMARKIREIDEEIKAAADRRAREVIALAIPRIASDPWSALSGGAVLIPSGQM